MNRLQQIKYKRMKPEERFLYDIMVQLEPYINDKKPTSTYYTLNGELLFEYDRKKKCFWCKNDKVCSILTKKFNLTYRDEVSLIRKMSYNILKIDLTDVWVHWITSWDIY